jgi:hypothetical protein
MIHRVGILAFAAALCAQEAIVERVLPFRHAQTPQSWQEITNAVRSTSDLREAMLDSAAGTLTVRGPAGRIAVAEWMFGELDRPTQPATPNSDMHEFRPAGTTDVIVSVYYLSRVATPQGIQEVVNAARSVTDTQIMFPANAARAIVMRGTATQAAMSKWVFQQLDGPRPENQTTEIRELRPQGASDFVIRIVFLANLRDPRAIQDVVNGTRAIADVQRFFPISQSASITMRGTAAQAELCAWMVSRLDTMAPLAAGEYVVPGSNNGVVRLFVPSKAMTPEALQAAVNRARAEAQAQRLFPLSSRSAAVFRGTAEQAAIAERALQ